MFQIDDTKASKKNAERDATWKCAACDKGPLDLKMLQSGLKRCTACYSVRYCGVACQSSHRKSHKKECKENANKRRDFNAVLFEVEMNEDVNPPPPPLDCDLCMYRMPPNAKQSKYFGCCGKLVCKACFARSLPGNPLFDMYKKGQTRAESFNSFLATFGPNGTFSAERRDEQRGCPFCRSTDDMTCFTKEHFKIRERCLVSRANKGDSRAVLELAWLHQQGHSAATLDKLEEGDKVIMGGNVIGWKQSPDGDAKALEYFKQAADLGNGDAYYELSKLHREDYNAADFYACLVKAADLGSTDARDELASLAMEKNQFKLAMAHYKLLAAAGYSKDSTEKLTAGYKEGYVTKDELASSLRAYQLAREELCSRERTQLSLFYAGLSSDGSLKPSEQFM